jgi:nucleotide-binding universal stress UspA family protein
MFKRVLLCHDGSTAGRRALRRGAELAILLNARVFVLSIVYGDDSDAAVVASSVGQASFVDSEFEYRKSLNESIALLKTRGVEAEGYLARGNTIDAIVEYAKRLSVDLIVVGHYPKSTGGRWWSGPERAALAERVNCSVLIAIGDTESIAAAGPSAR